MRFGIRWDVREAEGAEGGGAGADTAVLEGEEPKKPDAPTAPELTAHQKKMAELRAGAKKPDAAAAEEGEETSDDAADAPKDGSPGPKRTPKAEEKTEKPDAKAKPKADDKGKDEKAKPDPKLLTLALPSRHAGEDDVEFNLPRKALEDAGVDVKAFEERIGQLRKGFMRAEDLLPAREEIASQRAELQEVEDAIREDPVAFLVDRIEKPELHEKVALQLLTMLPQEAFDRILAQVDAMEKDPTKRENLRLKDEVARRDRATKARERGDQTRADLGAARKIGDQIVSVMSETDLDTDSPRATRFFNYAIDALARHAQKNKLNALDPATVRDLIVELGVLEDFGLKLKGEKPKAPAKPPKDAGKTPASDGKQDPRDRDQRRREATTTPSGDGAPASAGDRLPKGGPFGKKMNALRKRIGLPEKH